MRRLAVFVAGVVALALAPACSSGSEEGSLRIELDGRAIVGEDELESGMHGLDEGDVVEIVEGRGAVYVPGHGVVEVREGSKVEVGDEPALLAGDALAVGNGLRLSVDGTTLELHDGAARVYRTTGVAIGMYRGEADVTSGGRSLPGGLPALRQVVVPDAGLLPRRPAPLAYDDDPDPWDRRWLGAAIDLGAELEARSVGLTAAGGGGQAVVTELLGPGPGSVAASLQDNGGTRSTGEAAVGATIAATTTGGSLDERLGATFRFRDEGARWGLIALERRAEREDLLAVLDGALDDAAPILFTALPVSSSSPLSLLGIDGPGDAGGAAPAPPGGSAAGTGTPSTPTSPGTTSRPGTPLPSTTPTPNPPTTRPAPPIPGTTLPPTTTSPLLPLPLPAPIGTGPPSSSPPTSQAPTDDDPPPLLPSTPLDPVTEPVTDTAEPATDPVTDIVGGLPLG